MGRILSSILIISMFGCSSETELENLTQQDIEFIEAITYHHNFKVSAIIENLKENDQIDKLIPTQRVATEQNYWTPLCFSSFIGNRSATEKLINEGADIEFRDKNGQAPINLAAISGKVEILSLLLENGADINEKDDDGRTPIINATSNGNFESVKFLVERNCRLSETQGQDALDFAIFYQHKEIENFLRLQGMKEN